jgi:HEAT repeat protein
VSRSARTTRLAIAGAAIAMAVAAIVVLRRASPPPSADPVASIVNRSSPALSAMLRDAAATPEVRVDAGVALIQRDAATPADVAVLDGLVGRPGQARRLFVERFATTSRLSDDRNAGRWVLGALTDPSGEVRLDAVQALVRAGGGSAQHPQACDTVKALVRDADARLRARAVSLLQACPAAAQTALVHRALEDPDPAVRAAARSREQR